MKRKIAVLFWALPVWLWGQVPGAIPADTAETPLYRLSEVILVGDMMLDPVMTEQSQDLARKVVQPRNVADLFSDMPGFALIRRGNYAIDPSFRASMYEQLNVQFDGGTKVLHACPNRMDPITTHVSPEEIERIEVVKGPFSVRYGPVFGGVVNLVTRNPREFGDGLHGKVSTGYESNGDSYLTTVRLQQVWANTDLGTQVGWRDFGNYQDGDGSEVPSAFESFDYKVQLGHNFSDRQRLELRWRQSFGRDVLHAGLPMDTETDDSSVLSADYSWQPQGQKVEAVTFKAYHAFVDHLMTNALRSNAETVEASAAVDARTFGGKAETRLKWGDALVSFHGMDFSGIHRTGNRERLVKRNMMGVPLPEPVLFTDKIWQDAILNDFGFFSEARWNLSPKSWLTGGLRWDAVWSDIRDPEADFLALYPELGWRSEHYFAANLSLKTQLGPKVILEVAAGRGVRPASMIERFINHFTVGQDPYEYVGNPELDGEVNHQAEIGLQGTWDGLSAPMRFGFSAYYSDFSNYILPVIDPQLNRKFMPNAQPQEVKRFQNLEDAYKTGVEATVGMDVFRDFKWDVNLAYVYAKNQDLGESLPLTPPLSGSVRLAYQRDSRWADLVYRFASSQEDIAPSFGETRTPSYGVLDLRFGFNLTQGMRLGFAVLNLLDESYYDHLNFAFNNQQDLTGARIREPGRNASAYLQYQF